MQGRYYKEVRFRFLSERHEVRCISDLDRERFLGGGPAKDSP